MHSSLVQAGGIPARYAARVPCMPLPPAPDATMFIVLLLVALVVAAIVSMATARIFNTPVSAVLDLLVSGRANDACRRYLHFAHHVVGVSSGVGASACERDAGMPLRQMMAVAQDLTADGWALEIYCTAIGTLQGISWMLTAFFVGSLSTCVLVRVFEAKRRTVPAQQSLSPWLPEDWAD